MIVRHAPWADAPPGFSIGLAPIEPIDWFEPGEADPARKDALLAADPGLVFGETEGSRPAQAEALGLVEAATGQKARPDLAPLWAASRLVADDLCLMERRDGAWSLSALSLCSGTFFTAREALGKSLEGLHQPVEGLGDSFVSRMARIFDGLPAGRVVQRRNWTLVNDEALHLPDPAAVRARIPTIDPDEAGGALFVRVERQTLRRLPTSGAVLFTIRIWRHPLAALEGERLAAFAQAWRSAPPAFRAYKQLAAFDPLVEAFLARNDVG